MFNLTSDDLNHMAFNNIISNANLLTAKVGEPFTEFVFGDVKELGGSSANWIITTEDGQVFDLDELDHQQTNALQQSLWTSCQKHVVPMLLNAGAISPLFDPATAESLLFTSGWSDTSIDSYGNVDTQSLLGWQTLWGYCVVDASKLPAWTKKYMVGKTVQYRPQIG